ncbi:MAG: putative GatB/Yqey [Bacteroidetes bacterium]|nr:putative GatB/Yqey [Bacteroidota bacterium]
MGLKEQLTTDIQRSMKSNDKLRLETLRSLRAALLEKEIELRGTGKSVGPEDELAVLNGAAKKRRESIEMFAQGGRTDLVQQETAELAIIQELLPAQMTADEISAVIRSAVAAAGASSMSDFGRVMPVVMKAVKGRADGKSVQELVRKALGAS